MFCSSIDDLISQLITAEGQDNHVHMRCFNRSSSGPLKNIHSNIKEMALKICTMEKEE